MYTVCTKSKPLIVYIFHNRSSTKLLLTSQQALCFYLTAWQSNGEGGGRANVNDMPPRSTVILWHLQVQTGRILLVITCVILGESTWKTSEWEGLQCAVRQMHMTHQDNLLQSSCAQGRNFPPYFALVIHLIGVYVTFVLWLWEMHIGSGHSVSIQR